MDHDTGRLVWAAKGHDKKTIEGFFDLLGEQRCAKWVTDALDQVRRETWNEARRSGMTAHARDLKHARYALWKNPEDLTERQGAKLAWIAKVNSRLYRAYLLKEQIRAIIVVKGERALKMLKAWLAWASRSRIPAFVELGRRIRKKLPGVEAALLHQLSNALILRSPAAACWPPKSPRLAAVVRRVCRLTVVARRGRQVGTLAGGTYRCGTK